MKCARKGLPNQTESTEILTFDIVSVKLVALFHCAEASVLSNGPGSVCVHGRVGPSGVGEHTRQLITNVRRVRLSVHGFDGDALRSVPDQIFWIFPFKLFLGQSGPSLMKLHITFVGYRCVKESGAAQLIQHCRCGAGHGQQPLSRQRGACFSCGQHAVSVYAGLVTHDTPEDESQSVKTWVMSELKYVMFLGAG